MKLVLLPEVKTGGHFLHVFKKKLCAWQPLANFTIDHELVPPLPAFSSSDVSGKVRPKLNK